MTFEHSKYDLLYKHTPNRVVAYTNGIWYRMSESFEIHNFRKDTPEFAFPKQDKAELAFRLMDKDRDGTITKK